LREQVIAITGASSGIGLATARRAARAGASVFLISRDGPSLARRCAEIERLGGRAAFAAADVGDESQLRAAAQAALERFGRIDTWVNVAGVGIYARLLDTPRAEHERLFRTNYWGVVNASAIAIPHLRGGAFITVASVVADFGAPLLGAYSASKHAMKGFIDSLRIEILADGIPTAITLVKPSGIATPFADHAATHLPHAAKTPPPAYAPQIVAKAILFAAAHPRREITVGGVGALEILGAKLLPRVADRISAWYRPCLMDRRRGPASTHNLFGPCAGAERGARERALERSLYSEVTLHGGAATKFIALGLAAGGLSLLAWLRHRG
jgi:NAD(P)-dependent dehydrogenase (short-subunit alcohol dehydrogenase family)